MNPSLGVHSQNLSETTDNGYPYFEVILNFLKLILKDSSVALKFSKDFEIIDFQLGDALANYNSAPVLGNSVHYEQSQGNFYIVCQGRVRLLGFDRKQQREVSTLVLEAGETIGTENLFANEPLLTRAIASSAVQVAQMPITKLEPWLEQLPSLREFLHQQAMQRQCLTFFKTSTELRSLPSYQLQQLLPYFVETQVKSGQSLLEVASLNNGRFWLRHGQIQSPSGENSPPTVGQSWGYPQPIPSDWIAQTDSLVYYLPREHWETAQAMLLPGMSAGSSANLGNGYKPKSAAFKKVAVSHSPVVEQRENHPIQTQSEPQPNIDRAESKPIAFPQPANRRRRGVWHSLPFIEQQSSSDCGVACLAMIGQYWGKRFSLNTLRHLAGVDRAGTSLRGLAKAAETLGFHARPVRASFSRLESQINPWIAHWEGNHYVVVYRVKGDKILIADPALNKRSLSRQQFLDSWTGYALLLDPTERLQAAQSEKISLSQFWGAALPYRSLIGQIIWMSLLLQLFGLSTPLFTQIILDHVVVQKSFVTLNAFVLGLLLFGIWRIGLIAARQYLLDYFSNRFDLTLISGFINHTLLLPLKFFESRRVGDIITRVQENRKVQVFITRQAILAWLDALMAVVYIGLMFYYSWRLTLLVLALIPPIAILTLVATPWLRRVSREIFNEVVAQNSLLVEMLTGVATVKTAAAERDVRWRWEDRFTSALNAQFRGQNLGNGLQATGGLINTLGSTALLWYGATLVIQNQLSIGQFVAFTMMFGSVINPILSVVNLWDELQEVLISVERLNDVFSSPPEASPEQQMLVLPQLRGEVRFENVTFRYSPDQGRNTLQNITFEVGVGQTIAIVGRSGSGKSTLVNLLQGLYHPDGGRILVDGHDIRHISPQSLRSQMGVVPQECFLFSATILENITLYRSDFALEQVIEVAKLAEAHAFIQALPLGYNTQVGERGTTLSSGQRQRIAIARALLGAPRVLVLDEATSALDAESERRLLQNLSHLARDRTTFIIAHRLSTVRHADCILVLDRGILVERGTHEQLMNHGKGLYYHLAQQLDL